MYSSITLKSCYRWRRILYRSFMLLRNFKLSTKFSFSTWDFIATFDKVNTKIRCGKKVPTFLLSFVFQRKKRKKGIKSIFTVTWLHITGKYSICSLFFVQSSFFESTSFCLMVKHSFVYFTPFGLWYRLNRLLMQYTAIAPKIADTNLKCTPIERERERVSCFFSTLFTERHRRSTTTLHESSQRNSKQWKWCYLIHNRHTSWITALIVFPWNAIK